MDLSVLERWHGQFPKVVILGDSLVRWSAAEGFGHWTSSLANKLLKNNIDTHLRGFSGYCSRNFNDSMTKIFPSSYLENIELLIIIFGSNDSFDGEGANTTPQEYVSSIESIISYLKRHNFPLSKTLWISPIGHDAILANSGDHPDYYVVDRSPETLDTYTNELKKLALKHQLPIFDMLEYYKRWEPQYELLKDGYHYSVLGAKYFIALVLPIIESRIKANIGLDTLNTLKDLFNFCEQ